MVRHSSMARWMAWGVISWNTMRGVSSGRPRTWLRCQAIDSPSRSSSVAR